VADAGGSTGQPATGKGRKRSAVARKVESAIKAKRLGTPEVSQPTLMGRLEQ
jgi:hypothetical protein